MGSAGPEGAQGVLSGEGPHPVLRGPGQSVFFTSTRYTARLAEGSGDIRAAQRLRYAAFRDPGRAGLDRDAHDARCLHMLIEEAPSRTLVGTFRLMPLASGADIGRSYSAQFYGLEGLSHYAAPLAELGRVCVAPARREADILRVAWGALAGYVDAAGIEMLFGCASFPGTDPRVHVQGFELLRRRHLAPAAWRPTAKAARVHRFGQLAPDAFEPGRAMVSLPALLRSYLALGGGVSDHAVIDDDLGTLHVFTGLELRVIPPARARLLRAIAP